MFRVMTLPAELRFMIWRHLVPQERQFMLEIRRRNSDWSCMPPELSFCFTEWRDDEHLNKQIPATLALFRTDRQTSAEVKELFFGSNTFTFDLLVERSFFRDRFDYPELVWTLPKEFGMYAKRIHVDSSTNSLRDSKVELLNTAGAGVTLLAQALLSRRGTEPTNATRPPLQSLRITYDDILGLYHIIKQGEIYIEGHYVLEPLALLAQRNVNKVVIDTITRDMGNLERLNSGIETFSEKLRYVLTTGNMPSERASGDDQYISAVGYDWEAFQIPGQ